jgi:hypothetical protein
MSSHRTHWACASRKFETRRQWGGCQNLPSYLNKQHNESRYNILTPRAHTHRERSMSAFCIMQERIASLLLLLLRRRRVPRAFMRHPSQFFIMPILCINIVGPRWAWRWISVRCFWRLWFTAFNELSIRCKGKRKSKEGVEPPVPALDF